MKKSILLHLLLLVFWVNLIAQNSKEAIFAQCIEDHILFLKKEKIFLNEDRYFYFEGKVIPSAALNNPNDKLLTDKLLKVKTKRRNSFYVIRVDYVEMYGLGQLSINNFRVTKEGRKKYRFAHGGGSEYKLTVEKDNYMFTKVRQRDH
ncbi:MAG: hypothetical protein RIR11_5172 [Bacteroidota bacterium]|jgi:hypothetical protein